MKNSKLIVFLILASLASQSYAEQISSGFINPTPAPIAQVVAPTPEQQPATAAASKSIIKVNQDKSASIEHAVQPSKRHLTPLPGIGAKKFNTTLMHSNVVRTTGDGTDTVLISSRFPNRIATPFENPRVIGKTSAEVVKDGTSLFISQKSEDPFTLFITGSNPGDQVISVTFLPKDIPSQTIPLQLDSAQNAVRKAPKPEAYTQQLVDILRQVAIGKVPEGYSEGVMPTFIAKADKHGLIIMPTMRYSGSTFDIYKYRVDNNSARIELSESSFYQRGVRAVSIFPSVVLKKGESTNVYVLADKSILDGENNGR